MVRLEGRKHQRVTRVKILVSLQDTRVAFMHKGSARHNEALAITRKDPCTANPPSIGLQKEGRSYRKHSFKCLIVAQGSAAQKSVGHGCNWNMATITASFDRWAFPFMNRQQN
jgi:hypothetical protein